MTSPTRPIETWLTDMDGVLVHEEEAIPGAAEFVKRLRDRGRPFLLLTNNSIFTARDLQEADKKKGLPWTSAKGRPGFAAVGTLTPDWTQPISGEHRFMDNRTYRPVVPASGWHPEQFQTQYHETNWLELKDKPYVWGTFVWVGFDLASDGRDEGDRPGVNDKGLVTYDRSVRKDAWYWYQANWSERPIATITSGGSSEIEVNEFTVIP